MKLTQQQVNFFRHNGFLKLPQNLSSELLFALRERLFADFHAPIKPYITNDDGKIVKLYDLYGHPEYTSCSVMLNSFQQLNF